jgi:hypothetical protein
MVALTDVYTPNPACPVREIGGGLVIMAPEGDTTHSLEEIGTFIWNQMDGHTSLEGVLEAITTEYKVDRETARADLLDFVQEMVDAQLLIMK